MNASEYISKQHKDRQSILSGIHAVIMEEDSSVSQEVGKMMGKEMILYKENGHFKYGLSSVKNYMSLHIMPIYGSSPLHEKYQKLLPDAEFQKGCINFRNSSELRLDIVRRLFADCAKVSIAAKMETWKARKK